MLNIHSFLQRVKKPICKILPYNIGKYKNRMAVIAYAMATILFILSPDYIYGASNNGADILAKAETISLVTGEIEEETANEAIIRTNVNNLDSQFILCNLTTDGSPIGYEEQLTLKLIEEGKTSNSTVQSLNEKANSRQDGADANEKVDSSSTDKKEKQNTDEAVDEKEKASKKEADTAATEQEIEKSETKDTEQTVIDLSSTDIEILQRIVEAEATGEDIKGKILVANVILNRVKYESFPDTIEGVVFQKDGNTYQFSPIKDNRYWSVSISEDTITAVKRVMQGEDYSKGALYFSARSRAEKSSMSWFDSHLKFLFEYGGHEFFKDR